MLFHHLLKSLHFLFSIVFETNGENRMLRCIVVFRCFARFQRLDRVLTNKRHRIVSHRDAFHLRIKACIEQKLQRLILTHNKTGAIFLIDVDLQISASDGLPLSLLGKKQRSLFLINRFFTLFSTLNNLQRLELRKIHRRRLSFRLFRRDHRSQRRREKRRRNRRFCSGILHLFIRFCSVFISFLIQPIEKQNPSKAPFLPLLVVDLRIQFFRAGLVRRPFRLCRLLWKDLILFVQCSEEEL